MEKTFFYSTLFEYGYSSKEVQNWIDNNNRYNNKSWNFDTSKLVNELL